MVSQMLEGVCHLHENLVVHRDLKPANIFMSNDHDLILGDFGLSKMLSYKSEKMNSIAGTMEYMAPEQ